jgi:hypothetical protein
VIVTWQEVAAFMNDRCPMCREFLNNSPDCEGPDGELTCVLLPGTPGRRP